MDFVKQEIFNLDGNTQLEFLTKKTIVIIDKERFTICKEFMINEAPDESYANYLNIPIEKVRLFKHKMQLFEDSIRTRRRQSKLEKKRRSKKKEPVRKREISSEERFRRARELIARNYSTNQISKILKVSERSVTRFKRRMREEKMRLKAEGKIIVDPDDPDDEGSFRHLKPEEKMKAAKELFRKRLKIQEISEILKISERSVRRWKDRLSKLKKKRVSDDEEDEEPDENGEIEMIEEEVEVEPRPKRAARQRAALKIEEAVDESDNDPDFQETVETQTLRKKRRMYVDPEKVQYARELIENKLSNREMSLLLGMSIACVRKLKTKILDGTVDELIDDSAEQYTKLGKVQEESKLIPIAPPITIDPDTDPLMEATYYPPEASTSNLSYNFERKPKAVLREKEMFIARLLREKNIRTMDIAKMMMISERSVTRLLAKSRELDVIECDQDVLDEVDKLLAEKDEILNSELILPTISSSDPVEGIEPPETRDDSKRKLGLSLIAMNVKVSDIIKMLDVNEKTVLRWKKQSENDGTSVFGRIKEEQYDDDEDNDE